MGFVLLAAQVVLFVFLFLISNLIALFTIPHLLFFFITGLVIAGLGYLTIGWASYFPLPKPRKNNVLSRKGIYKYIRHPIYAGLMLVGFSFLLSRFTLLPTIFFALFVFATDTKANIEEQLMVKKHPKYKKYKVKVKKYIPFIF